MVFGFLEPAGTSYLERERGVVTQSGSYSQSMAETELKTPDSPVMRVKFLNENGETKKERGEIQ